ncbi:deoxyuridine 5'-triphosphate nucleotidohydrolase [Methanocaldococcus fervens]|uniref:Probable deoxyuridine 5'-triphosphate nucleotidohydrolase n=1 Tax=Methanocaldococcus fervens (strain DSM 4213 / JCM 15782 / AG86) TaxID=573064 RepID=C7P7R7_METFA|nr:deoxyuridine 5'-triphosphate nucleotidohydrolase [Methanocaldococcus fervens]ACV24599.1 deoxyUTP pyrophosphatase [Methanocaldococcus fervens AG86]
MIIGANTSKNFFDDLDEKQIQQCGIDLRVWKIFKIEGEGTLDFSNEKRKLPNYVEIFNSEKDESITLDRGIYVVKVADYMKIPENVAGFAYPRSSLLRMGATIYSAVHDPGYEGRPEYLMHVFNPIKIYRYARIAQIVFIECRDVKGVYEGIYKGK